MNLLSQIVRAPKKLVEAIKNRLTQKFTREFYSRKGKYSDKWSSYLGVYDEIISKNGKAILRILEIGVQNGGSLEQWSRVLPRVHKIVGCDIDPKCSLLTFRSPQIKIVIGDVSREATVAEIKTHSEIFDLIVDDGSHHSVDIISAFCRLFPILEKGGLYVIEDLHCSYWEKFGGGLRNSNSAVEFLKVLIDAVNYPHWAEKSTVRSSFEGFPQTTFPGFLDSITHVESVEFVNSMCVVRKGFSSSSLGHRVGSGSEVTVEPEAKNSIGTSTKGWGSRK